MVVHSQQKVVVGTLAESRVWSLGQGGLLVLWAFEWRGLEVLGPGGGGGRSRSGQELDRRNREIYLEALLKPFFPGVMCVVFFGKCLGEVCFTLSGSASFLTGFGDFFFSALSRIFSASLACNHRGI